MIIIFTISVLACSPSFTTERPGYRGETQNHTQREHNQMQGLFHQLNPENLRNKNINKQIFMTWGTPYHFNNNTVRCSTFMLLFLMFSSKNKWFYVQTFLKWLMFKHFFCCCNKSKRMDKASDQDLVLSFQQGLDISFSCWISWYVQSLWFKTY